MKPRKVLYCLWNDGTKHGTRMACEWLRVIECPDRETADRAAKRLLESGELRVNNKTLYTHLRNEYYVMDGVFPPTVFVYKSYWGKDKPERKQDERHCCLYGYFLSRWALDADYSGFISRGIIRGKLNCNFYSIEELDTEHPVHDRWLTEQIERIGPNAELEEVEE